MRYETLGLLLRTARAATKLEQQDVARQLEVGQQAVSSWERGASRPRVKQLAALCSLLGLPVEQVQAAGGYESPQTFAGSPRLLVLPFENLSDQAFEAFCRDLLRSTYPGRVATRNGSSGFKQHGIDVIVGGGGERIGVQCKRHRTFGPKDAEAAIAEVSDESRITRGVIALSRTTATPATRLAVADHDRWELWDGEDLSVRVRELPKAAQLVLVDSYFPGLRMSFLGVKEPSPWLKVTEYDTALAGRSGYERSFPLAGRANTYSKLSEMVGNHEPVVIIVGRGGIGKSRLLTELATLEVDREVVFAARGPISAEAFEHLPEGAPVIVIDDAMDADVNVEYLVRGIRNARPDATVVFSVHPKAASDLQRAISISEAQASKITVAVDDLSIAEAEALAGEALGDPADERSVEALARIGYDCPLLIVIGAHLIREGHLSPQTLSADSALRRQILTQFADVTVRGSNGDARIEVLTAIAAVQPARLDQPDYVDAVSGLSGHPLHAVMQIIDELDDLGAVMMRGQSVRVVPDLLGEAILERALVSKSGLDTKYAARVAQYARGDALASAIRNVSIIDWYRRLNGHSQLAEILWGSLIESALALPNSERMAMATGVQEVAAVYPQFALDFAARILENPAPDELDPYSGIWGKQRFVTGDDCARSLAHLIRNSAYNLDYMKQGIILLLAIAEHDDRPENQNPEHAMRLLREMGEYHPARSVTFNESFVRIIGDLLDDSTYVDVQKGLLGLLKPALADEVMITHSKGLSISFSRAPVDLAVVAPTRVVAIELAARHLAGSPATAEASISLLEEALRAGAPDDPVAIEFGQVAKLLGEVLTDRTAFAGLRLSAYRALSWHATYGSGERKALARATRRQLFVDTDYRLVRMLRAGWALDDEDLDDTDVDEPETATAQSRYQRSVEANELAMNEIIESWSDDHSDDELLAHLHFLMREEQSARGTFLPPDGFLVRLFSRRLSVARAALRQDELGDRASATTQRTALVAFFACEDPAVESAARILSRLGTDGAMLVANALIQISGPLSAQRKKVIKQLVNDADPIVMRILLSAARWFDASDHVVVLDLIREAPIETDDRAADEVAGILADGRVVAWASLTPTERSEFLARFLRSPRLASFNFGQVLNEQIRLDAVVALNFLQARVDQSLDRTEEFDALPFSWDTPLAFRSSPAFPDLLAQLVEWLVDGDTWQRSFHGVQLFEQVVGAYDDEVRALLLRLIRSNDVRPVRLASELLSKAQHDFVIAEPGFVAEAIVAAQNSDTELSRLIYSGLHGSATFGMRSRTVGVDDPEELSLRDSALSLARRQPPGTPIAAFYDEVAARATRRLESERADDANLEQPRRW